MSVRRRKKAPPETGTSPETSPRASESPNAPIRRIDDRFHVVDHLGSGSGGAVYHVWDELLNQDLALKVLAGEQHASGVARERFLREAASLRRLVHPHVVQTFDAGEHEGSPYLVMELMRGRSVQDQLKERGAVSPTEAVSIMSQVLSALAYIHAEGVVHRDVKPHNLLISDTGVVKLGDFGIAQNSQDDLTLTGLDEVVGTRGYMPPEQEEDPHAVGPSADLFAAGATLWVLLTGGGSPQLLTLVAREEQLARVPFALRGVVRRATEYRPASRYGTAEEMNRALGRAARAHRIVEIVNAGRRWLPMRGLEVAVRVVAVLLLVFAVPVMTDQPSQAASPATVSQTLPPSLLEQVKVPSELASAIASPVVDAASSEETLIEIGEPSVKEPDRLPEERAARPNKRDAPSAPEVQPEPAEPSSTLLPPVQVIVNSEPNRSKVYVNGQVREDTPYEVSLLAGETYMLRLVEDVQERAREHTIRLTLSPNSPEQRICWDFELNASCPRAKVIEDPRPTNEPEG